MIKEQKNKFLLKIILMLTLAFSAFAIVFACNHFTKETVVNASADESVNALEEDVFAKDGLDTTATWTDDSGNTLEGTTLNLGSKFSPETEFKITKDTSGIKDYSCVSGFTVEIGGKNYYPTPKIGYEIYAIWLNNENNDNNGQIWDTTSTEEITAKDIDPNYTGKITIKALSRPITYTAYMYYSLDEETWTETSVTFNCVNPTDLDSSIISNKEGKTCSFLENNRTFASWAVKSKTNGNISFSGSGSCTVDGTIFYYVNTIQGYSSSLTNFKLSETEMANKTGDPTIRATWSYLYNGVIDNNYTDAVHYSDNNLFGAKSDQSNNTYRKYYNEQAEKKSTDKLTDHITNSNKQAYLEFAFTHDNSSYDYKFKTNATDDISGLGSAFMTATDCESISDDYAVYNYGYYISGWQIYYEYGKTTTYFTYDGTSWGTSSTATKIDIDKLPSKGLSKKTFQDLASYLNTYFIKYKINDQLITGYKFNDQPIYLKPVWTATTINVTVDEKYKNSDNKTVMGTVTYGSNYLLSDCEVGTGQTVFYYKTEGNNVIIKSGDGTSKEGAEIPWNYVNIPYGDFFAVSGGTYTLEVEPVYTNNLYKINLTGVKLSSETTGGYTYVLENSNTNYTFSSDGYDKDVYTIFTATLSTGVLSYTNNFNDTAGNSDAKGKFVTYLASSITSVEEYISKYVTPFLAVYNEQINGDKEGNECLPALRKVFASTSASDLTVSVKSGDANTLILSTLRNLKDSEGVLITDPNDTIGVDLWMYLAHNQTAGKLPVFNRQYLSLINWQYTTTEQTNRITTLYDATTHAESLTNGGIKNINNEDISGVESEEWKATATSTHTFVAQYYRKNYLLDLNTLRIEKNQEGRYGYIYIKIEDVLNTGEKSADIIAVYDKEKNSMEYYNIVVEDTYEKAIYAAKAVKVSDANEENESGTGLELRDVTVDGKTISCIVLYAGCDVTIKASCVDDIKAEYDDMFGYYLKSVTTSHTDNVNSNNFFANADYNAIYASKNGDIEKGYYIVEVSGETIEGYNYSANTKITVNANFAPIEYHFVIKLDNKFSGQVECSNQNTSISSDTITLKATVEDLFAYVIQYSANAGYTLKESAIVLIKADGNTFDVLNYYQNKKTGEIIEIDGKELQNLQNYTFTFNGTWLRQNYYESEYNAKTYSEESFIGQDIKFDVNTDLLTFDYQINIVDDMIHSQIGSYQSGYMQLNGSNTASNIALIDAYGTTFSIKDNYEFPKSTAFNVISKALLGKEFTTISYQGQTCYIIVYNGTKYAIMSSHLPQITSTTAKYNLEYDFMLNSLNGLDYQLTQDTLNTIFGSGTIANPNNRTLIMQINVKELYTITIKVTEPDKPDINDSDRSTTIANGDNNSATLTTSDKSDYTGTCIVYTYEGAENSVSSTFDEKRYTGVTYKLGDSASALTDNKFVLTRTAFSDTNKNIDFYVTYNPKPITEFNVTYQLDGVESSSVKGNIISDNSDKYTSIELYANQSINFQYQLINPGYTITSVTLNSINAGSLPDDKGKYTIKCEADSDAYNAQGFYIIINVSEIPQGTIAIKYVLDDTSTSCTGDDYGSLKVLANGTNVAVNGPSPTFTASIVEKAKVEVDLSSLSDGYHFVECGTITTLTDNKFTLIDSFNLSSTNNTYYIKIAKDTICAVLSVSGDYKDKYKISTDGIETKPLSDGVTYINAYLGKTISFTDVDEDREVLDHYYYENKDKKEQTIDDSLSLKLTPALLSQLLKSGNTYTLNIGVVRTPKYNLTYSIVNAGYVEDSKFYVGENENDTYRSGTNKISGTEINVYVLAKNTDKENKTSKYNITVTGDCNEEITTGVFEKKFTLDSDKTITIKITPKTFNNSDSAYSEYIYNDYTEYKNRSTPTTVETPNGGFNINSTFSFGATATATLSLKTADGELDSITISGNDNNTYIVYFNGKQIVRVYDETDGNGYAISENYKLNNDEVKNPTKVLKQAGYNLEFINVAGDQLKITYTVSNKISISATYLSYKVITVL